MVLHLTLRPGQDREGWRAGENLQGPHGFQDAALQPTQHQHHNDADELGSQPVAVQSFPGGSVEEEVAVEGQECRHAEDNIHVQVGVDRFHLVNKKAAILLIKLRRI